MKVPVIWLRSFLWVNQSATIFGQKIKENYHINDSKYWSSHLEKVFSCTWLLSNSLDQSGHQQHHTTRSIEFLLDADFGLPLNVEHRYTVDGSVRSLIMLNYFAIHNIMLNMYMAPTWSWSYGSWIYNYMYLCNQCLSPLKLWVRTQLRQNVLDTTLFNIKSLSVTWGWSVFSQGTLVSSTNKTNRHDITGIFLKWR